MEKSTPVYFLRMNPPGWKRASLPKFSVATEELSLGGSLARADLLRMNWSQRQEYMQALAVCRQEKAWENATGIRPEASAFTLIVPIYNEERSLPSFLHTLLLSDLPAQVPVQVIFATNACTDRSVELVETFMAHLGLVEQHEMPDNFGDQNMDPCYTSVRAGGHVYLHINTSTPGKAHVLDIGNRLALQQGHLVAMSVDANNFMEPDALRQMFTHAHQAFRERLEAGDTVLFSAVGKENLKDAPLKKLLGKISGARHHLVEVGEGVVNGWMLAWNTQWVSSIGGPPAVALEDYALGVLARVSGFKIAQAPGVNVWGYVNNDLKGLLMTRARYVRGKLQILDYVQYEPAILALIESEAFYMKNRRSRVKHVCSHSFSNPLRAGRYLATFLLWEYAIWQGTRDYKRNPTNQSWEKIASTY